MDDLSFEIHRLRKNYEKLRLEFEKLKEENKTLTEKVKAFNSQVKIIQGKDKSSENDINLHITGIIQSDDAQKAALKRKLDEVIKEIDECLSQLDK